MKVKLTLALLATAISATADTPRLIEALVRVESNGKANAVGDSGKAFGILQIHEITVKEANRLAQTRFTHADMMNPTKSREVATIVLNHYAKHIQKTTGRPATAKELAFIWNGGAAAWKRVANPMADTKQKNLENYWNKVSRLL
jgi:soluble lytic murein transglycosylase-like protein